MSSAERTASDKWEIAETLSRYAFTVDFWSWGDFDQVFAEDATAHYEMEAIGFPSVHLKSRAEIAAWLSASIPPLGQVCPRHALTNHIFDLKGDAARTRSYLNAGGPGAAGVYTMDHIRTPQGWRVTRLHMKNFTRTPMKVAGT
jgi:hypothetical protein